MTEDIPLPTRILNGEAALAHGAVEAGVQVVTGYPGTPSSGTLEALLPLTRPGAVHVEWSTNEKVALEVAIGASLAGRRALVCVKSVGMNVLLDPLMTVNLTGVNGGLVVLLGDDPGAYGSQNDQDTRPIAAFAELPLLEPSTPQEGASMMKESFELSERFATLFIVRETRSFSRKRGPVSVAPAPGPRDHPGMIREPFRWVPYPQNAVNMHGKLHRKVDRLREWASTSTWNTVKGHGRRGIIAAGFAYDKLLDLLGNGEDGADGPRRLKLGTIHPAPDRLIAGFLEGCDETLVLEENEPFLEAQIRSIAHEHRAGARVLGKLSGHVSREGELFRWQIQQALERFIDDFVPARSFTRDGEEDERPFKKDYCAGCPFPEIVDVLRDVGRELGQNPVLVGDPGCIVKAADRLDAKYAMGSAVAVVQGMSRAGLEERPVAIFGDSSFFHSGLPALINAVCNRTPLLMVVLDNSATVTSGFQPNPGSGRGARGDDAPRLSIETIARACGIQSVRTVGPDDGEDELRAAFREGLRLEGHGLIVVRRPCERPAENGEA